MLSTHSPENGRDFCIRQAGKEMRYGPSYPGCGLQGMCILYKYRENGRRIPIHRLRNGWPHGTYRSRSSCRYFWAKPTGAEIAGANLRALFPTGSIQPSLTSRRNRSSNVFCCSVGGNSLATGRPRSVMMTTSAGRSSLSNWDKRALASLMPTVFVFMQLLCSHMWLQVKWGCGLRSPPGRAAVNTRNSSRSFR